MRRRRGFGSHEGLFALAIASIVLAVLIPIAHRAVLVAHRRATGETVLTFGQEVFFHGKALLITVVFLLLVGLGVFILRWFGQHLSTLWSRWLNRPHNERGEGKSR